MQKIFKNISLSIITSAIVVAISGCSGGGDTKDPVTGVGVTPGGVIDGYLKQATLFVDDNDNGSLDQDEFSLKTDDNGDFTLDTTELENGVHIYAFGGIDRSTNAPFEGKLAAIYDVNSSEIILSPLTTYVAALVDSNVSLEQAKTKVATALGIDSSAVSSDPMTNSQVFFAAQKVQKTVEVLASTVDGNDFQESYAKVFASLAKTSSNDFNATALVQQIKNDHGAAVDGNVTNYLNTYTSLVDDLSDANVSATDLDSIGNVLDSYTQAVQGAIENNTSVASIEESLQDLNATKVVEDLSEGNFTDPIVEATDAIEYVFDNNVSYLGTNNLDGNITSNLVLTDPHAAPFDTNDLNLTWSSSNPTILSVPSGTITRSKITDEQVVLSATVANNLVTNVRNYVLTIKRIEFAPSAVPVTLSLSQDSSGTVSLTDKVSDENNDTLDITITQPSHGTATLNGTTITYTPTVGYNGSDTLTYTVTDTTGRSASATITFIVNEILPIVNAGDAAVLINSPAVTANVDNAKFMFSQIRETALTFVDPDAVDTNTSTVIGSQADMINNKLKPAVEDIQADFNTSVDSLNNSVQAFTDAINVDFNTTVSAFSDRIKAIVTQIDDNNYTKDQNWSVTTTEDTLEHNVTVDGNISTEVFTFNDTQTLTTKRDVVRDEITYVDGGLEVTGSGYDINIKNVNFDNQQVTLISNGRLDGDNGAYMDLAKLNIESDLNTSVDIIGGIQNPNLSFVGTVVATGRQFDGNITVTPLHTYLSGTYTGMSDEPSFDGNITLEAGLNSLLDDIALRNDSTYIDHNAPILVAQFADNSRNFIPKYERLNDQWNDDNNGTYTYSQTYRFYTQNDVNFTCDINKTNNYYVDENGNHLYTDENNTVTCEDGINLLPIYSDNARVTVKVNGVEKVIGDAWVEWDNNLRKQKFHFRDEGDTYFDANDKLSLNGEAITVTDINLTQSPELFDRTFDVMFEGKITDASKVIEATVGFTKDVYSKLYAKDILISDGTSFAKIDELNITMSNNDFVSQYGSNSGDGSYSEPEFENYYVSYQNHDDNNEFDLKTISAIALQGLVVSLNDSDNNTLRIDANVSVTNDTNITANFDGKYTYAGAQFVGHIDTNGFINDADEFIGNVNVLGNIEANGFVPFDMKSTIVFSVSKGVDAYVLFTRNNNYQLGLHLVNTYNGDEETFTMDSGDTNGVLGHIRRVYNHETDTGDNLSLSVTDKDGNSLATVGEDSNGNGWEIQYSDGTAETLF